MKHTTTLTILCTAVLLAGCGGEAASPTPSGKHQVAVIGDSFTEGTDLGGLGWRSWPAVARHDLLAEGTVIDLNVSAAGSAGYAIPGYTGNAFSDEVNVLSDRDDLVIFFGGLNDVGVDPVGVATAARNTFVKAKTKAPNAMLMVIGPAWPTAHPPENVLAVRDVLRDQAKDAGLEFVDPIAENWFVDKAGLVGGDGVHPTDEGHKYLADQIAPLIQKAFGID